jgi:D-arabinose 1-dehydrogenase-like Zn-dependent alcohol dehydrogenase
VQLSDIGIISEIWAPKFHCEDEMAGASGGLGLNGLGHLAVEFLRELCAAKIIAVDMGEKALEMAAERGADVCLRRPLNQGIDVLMEITL